MRRVFNVPEVVALLREDISDDDAYWRRVLRYCAEGCLQGMFDEWAHVLPESLGVRGKPLEDQGEEVARAMSNAFSMRSAPVVAERVIATSDGVAVQDERYRTRLALRFGEQEVDDGEDRVRATQVRDSFNSPLWPFVLASTTVGQEGLDFHQYCHAVVHWNLPHNPVDLEQREGRVHRYKGHAVRKNVARRYGKVAIESGAIDPWARMFELAAADRAPDAGDIVPYWVFPLEGGARIERHVPALPLSRDVERLESLRRTLVLYRMVFGQPRQDELVRYLDGAMERLHADSLAARLRIDLTPPRRTAPLEPRGT